jgi:hypothetical protein
MPSKDLTVDTLKESDIYNTNVSKNSQEYQFLEKYKDRIHMIGSSRGKDRGSNEIMYARSFVFKDSKIELMYEMAFSKQPRRYCGEVAEILYLASSKASKND